MTEKRATYIAGLRQLADLLDTHPDLVLPLKQTFSAFCGTREELHDWIRAVPGTKCKRSGGADGAYMVVDADEVFGPHTLSVWIERDEVCRRVVTGTREVTRTVATATEEVTVTEDVVEWECEPILAAAVTA